MLRIICVLRGTLVARAATLMELCIVRRCLQGYPTDSEGAGAIRTGLSSRRWTATLAVACVVLACFSAACDRAEQPRLTSNALPTAPTTPAVTLVTVTI